MRSRFPASRQLPALLAGLLLRGLGLAPRAARASDEHAHHHHHHHAASAVSRSETTLTLPRVSLRSQDGAAVVFTDVLDDGRPVLLNFI